MKINIILVIIILFFLSDCRAQKENGPSSNLKSDTMEIFNVREFQQHQEDGEYVFNLPDGSEVYQIEDKDSSEYFEEIHQPDKPFTLVRTYYMNNGNLKSKGEKFYNFPIGTWHYYDERSNLIKEINWEKSFVFSIADLYRKMKEYQIDIMNTESGVNVARSEEPSPYYRISSPVEEGNYMDLRIIKIDGVNGKTILDTIVQRK